MHFARIHECCWKNFDGQVSKLWHKFWHHFLHKHIININSNLCIFLGIFFVALLTTFTLLSATAIVKMDKWINICFAVILLIMFFVPILYISYLDIKSHYERYPPVPYECSKRGRYFFSHRHTRAEVMGRKYNNTADACQCCKDRFEPRPQYCWVSNDEVLR